MKRAILLVLLLFIIVPMLIMTYFVGLADKGIMIGMAVGALIAVILTILWKKK